MRGAPTGQAAVAVLSSAASGGAGIAARRLADALADHTELGADFIDIETLGERLPADVAPPGSFTNGVVSDVHFSVEHPGYVRGWLVDLLSNYDVVNVHWAVGLVSLGEIAAVADRGVPVVLTLHDVHHLSGGCHYPGPCGRLLAGCHGCPQIDRARASPLLPARVRRVRAALLRHPNIHVVAPSRWLRDRAVAAGAPAERAEVLRNPYRPLADARPGAAGGAPRVLLIADHLGERRKNVALAVEALALWRSRDGARFVVDLVGLADAPLRQRLADAGIAVAGHGRIEDHGELARVLARASLVLSASLEDNWPNVLVEAGAHGAVPVVGPGHGAAEFVAAYGVGAVAADFTAGRFADALAAAARAGAADRLRLAEAVRRDHDPATVARLFRNRFAAPPAPLAARDGRRPGG